jgi:(2Fe-2S) ferredoxin
MQAERIPQLVREHLLEGKPLEEWIFARNPLSAQEQTEHS